MARSRSYRKYLDVKMPLGGQQEVTSFQKHPPFTTPDSQNVIIYDSVDGRQRLGSRPGLAADGNDVGGDFRLLMRVEFVDGSHRRRDRLIAIMEDGQIYRTATEGTTTFTSHNSTALRFDTSHLIHGVVRNAKVYIADYDEVGPAAAASDGTIGGGSFTQLDSATYTDWTDLPDISGVSAPSVNANDYVVALDSVGANSRVTIGTYTIATVASGVITLSSSPTGGQAETGISFRVIRSPKVYNPINGTVALYTATASKGAVPLGHPAIALFRDRVVFAGGPDAPHNWHASRSGDPLDWLVSDTDALRAVSGAGGDAGQIGEPVTALITHADQCMLIGCRDSMWIMRGDPAFGGQIDNLSYEIGVLDKGSWCQTPMNETIFMSRDGIYMCPRSCGATSVTPVSRQTLPEKLIDVDYSNRQVLMEYDLRFKGIWIFQTPASGTGEHWFLSWQDEAKGFWQIVLQDAHQPTAIAVYPMIYSTTDSGVILGGVDGSARQFAMNHDQDAGSNAISSFVFIGPINLGGVVGDAIVTELHATTDTSSGDVDWELRMGQSAEQAFGATARESGNWNYAGRNSVDRPRARGSAAVLKLTNGEASARWALESLGLAYEPAGRMRANN